MARVSRTDKLRGAGGVITGGVELAIAADASLDRAQRRYSAFFGVVSIVAGIGQGRGIRALGWVSVAAAGAWWTWEAREARRAPRVRPASPESRDHDALREAWNNRNVAPLTRRDRLTSGRLIASGVISLAIAADGSVEAHRRRGGAVSGVLAIVGGLGCLRRSGRAHLIVMGGHAVFIPTMIAGAIMRRLPRR